MVSVLTRHTRLILATALVVATLGFVVAPGADAAGSRASVVAKKNPAKTCKGVKYKQVKGERPAYASKLRTYGIRNATCRAYWAAGANSDFVPQAVAVEGGVAWVSGYTWPTSSNLCRIEKIDLRTGAVLAQQSPIYARDDAGNPYYCRHGGGLTVDARGMWISASGELWYLDRNAIGVDPEHVVVRHWRVDTKSNVSASLNTTVDGYVLLGAYDGNPAESNVSYVSQDALLAPGVDRVTMKPTLPTDVAPVLQQPIPLGSQGLAAYQGLVTTQCGGATLGTGKRVNLIPGIEDIEFVPETKKAYIISESGSRPLHSGNAIVPFLSEVSTKKLTHLPAARGC